ncbi:2-nitropropane dioxygenase [Apiospora marii]|uniref:2-nitropropane dioxygenase n=1 Tax=Apiospora marii TaxID=335849 RepID=A0ABR1R7R1_9PEZI
MSLLRFKALTPTPAIRRFATTMASSTARTRMQRWFPTTSSPLIVSAPMDFVTNATLASEVSKAGGLGFIQGGRDFTPGCAALSKLDRELGQARNLLSGVKSSENTLPLGVGFVAYAPSVSHFAETAVPVLESYRPAAVWLFAPAPDQPGTIGDMIRALRSSSSSSPGEWNDQVKVAVQVGSVAAAREAVQYGADIVVAQGVDAGGHQWARGASVVSLVPEIADMVSTSTGSTGREVAVWAAGGLAEGRGVAASLVLGAEAAVLGTRFMVAAEADTQEFKRKAILSTSDGGMNTVKATCHGPISTTAALWSTLAIKTTRPACPRRERGQIQGSQRRRRYLENDYVVSVNSGTGVGLIKESLPAGEVVKQLRESATKALQPKSVL